jgi:maltose O-acetyltransferase
MITLPTNLVNRLLRFPDWVRGKRKTFLLRLGGARIGRNCFIRNIEVPCDAWALDIGNHVGLDNGVVICMVASPPAPPGRDKRVIIHDGVYINRYTVLDALARIEIGTGTLIGPNCFIGNCARGRIRGVPLWDEPVTGEAITIGENVLIGAGVIIVSGVTVGDNAIIGAGAVVTHDVAAGETVAGVPAKPLLRHPPAAAA